MTHLFAFTVFTPTFNRAKSLDRVYTSLKQQTFRNFEWLIVDDGSTDSTQSLVESWRNECNFPVRYVWQKNAGKHIATNHGVQLARGELFLNADSDDSFLPYALSTFYKHWQSIPVADRMNFAGICGLCQFENGRVVGDLFPEAVFDSTPSEIFYRYRIKGEKWGVVRTDVMQEFPFRDDIEKTYLSENLVWYPMGKKYKTRFVNEILRVYHTDQSSIMRDKRRVRYPLSGQMEHLYYLNEEIPDWWRSNLSEFTRSAVHYSRFSFHLGKGLVNQFHSLKNSKGRALWLASLPIGFLVYVRDRLKPNV